MTRSLTTAVKNELATNDIRPVHLITIGFGTPVNLTDCSFSLTSSVSGSSVTYTASDFILGISNHTEETDITKSSVSISLSGADQTYISLALAENIVNDAVTIYRAFLDANNAIIADPFLLYKGSVETTLHQMLGGLRQSMGYTGNKDIESMRTKTKFVKITASGINESHVHDVNVTKEAPNYRIR